MNNFVLDRIKIQNKQARVSVVTVPPPPPQPQVSPAIPPSALKEIFMSEINKSVEPVAPPPPVDEKRFENIYEFADWYALSSNQQFFSEPQQTALQTLMDARFMIENGCGCKRKQRERAAFEYFKNFWQENKNNDMLPTLLKATNAKRISIGNIVSYSYT